MSHAADSFVYEMPSDSADALIAELATTVRSERELFAAVDQALSFPDYFGNNWDALDECLNDLSWIDQQRVVLVHRVLPELDERALKLYLETLHEAVVAWEDDDSHELVVVLPAGARATVEQLLG